MGKQTLGDKVVVETKTGEFVGVIMPRPPMSDKKHLTLKLENGYNIGLYKKEVSTKSKA